MDAGYRPPSVSSPWERLYRTLQLVYPAKYRARFGEEMSHLFADLVARERSRGGRLAAARIVARSFLDLPRSALLIRRWSGTGRQPQQRQPKLNEKMETISQDIRYALRTFRRAPGFTAAIFITLALGIGANTAIFSVINGVLLRPLPYENPEELVFAWVGTTTGVDSRLGISGPDLVDMRQDTELFSDFAAGWGMGTNLAYGDTPEQITLSWVSTNFFSLLGVTPAVGRTFRPEDKTNTDVNIIAVEGFTPPPAALVLSYGLWQRSFGGDPEIVGRIVRINGQSMNVIGVAPPEFRLYLPPDATMPADADAWTLFPVDLSRQARGTGNFTTLGRMRKGITVEQAQEELNVFSSQLRDNFQVHSTLGTELNIAPLHAEVVGHIGPLLWTLFGAVGFVLLIACANVANLLLVRASSREREFAIRGALGGSRGRLIRQTLTEAMLLSLAGAAGGVLLAKQGIVLLLTFRPDNLPRVDDIGIDNTVLLVTLGASVLAAVFFGLIPAFQLGNTGTHAALKDRGAASMGTSKNKLRNSLVVTEIALSLVLLIGAGLLFRSFGSLSRVQPGFNPENLVTANISLPFFDYRDWNKRTDFFTRAADGLANIPGVESVGGISALPLSQTDGQSRSGRFALNEGEGDSEEWLRSEANYRAVMPGLFETMQIQLLSGRTFTDADNRPDVRSVAIVDEKLAGQIWPDQEPIGQQLYIQVPNATQTGSGAAWTEIVGVVEHVRHNDLTQDGLGTIYTPYHTHGWFEHSFVVKTALDEASIAAAIRRVVNSLDPELPIFAVRTMDDYLADAMAPVRFAMVLIGIFAGVAIVLASVGLYGVIAYLVHQRTREIGIRIAFGAASSSIVGLVVGQGMILATVGVLLGIGAALAVTSLVTNLLFGIAPTDPVTFGTISLLLFGIATVASYLPARRAMRVDPMEALRNE